jgi:hypothetical protein
VCGLAIYIKKYLKAKEELKKPKILQDIRTLQITNLMFQHKPKYHLSKILIKNIDVLLCFGTVVPSHNNAST